MNQLAMEEADSYNDCSWEASDYDESVGEGEGVDPESQELEAEADSHLPSTQRCIFCSSNQSHICPVKEFIIFTLVCGKCQTCIMLYFCQNRSDVFIWIMSGIEADM